MLALGSVWLVQRLQRDVRAEGFHRVEPARIRIDPAGGAEVWFDRRWSRELELTLASFPPFDLDDADARARLTDALAALSFVAEVGEASGVWPDGLRLPLRPHVPVAVVLAGNRYLAVAPDGTVLSGAWPAPPRRDGGWLPVLGPNDGAFERARPGDVLVERRHLDALSVACSLWRHLDPLTEVRLGRARIDGSEEPVASPTDPGVVLWLEGGRQIWFGRPACTDEPGELPVEAKWRHLSAGLEQVAVTGADWIALDVRWDRPEVRLAEGAESALTASGAGEAVR